MQGWYAEYDPVEYERTESSYLGSNAFMTAGWGNMLFGEQYVSGKTDDGYIAGIEVSPQYIIGEPYRAREGKDWVFERTFQQGIHGFTFDEVKKYRKNGNKTFKKIKNVPRKSRSSPEKKMDRLVSRLSKRTINKIVTEEIIGALK